MVGLTIFLNQIIFFMTPSHAKGKIVGMLGYYQGAGLHSPQAAGGGAEPFKSAPVLPVVQDALKERLMVREAIPEGQDYIPHKRWLLEEERSIFNQPQLPVVWDTLKERLLACEVIPEGQHYIPLKPLAAGGEAEPFYSAAVTHGSGRTQEHAWAKTRRRAARLHPVVTRPLLLVLWSPVRPLPSLIGH
ncbi:hypothetical protein NDU88_001973 [Pleurodeles waltl]|uniref:Uncharacterized protein n=1 Tax=Pleurodeles waltl TaxID=8319 RepID=A0AAV7SE63_PLEWA|nr:hypothetical protein NDU88_001973 [Pleurodeles waltl]